LSFKLTSEFQYIICFRSVVATPRSANLKLASSSCDRELWPTFDLNLRPWPRKGSDKSACQNLRQVSRGSFISNSYCPDRARHTHRTNSSSWSSKVVDNVHM